MLYINYHSRLKFRLIKFNNQTQILNLITKQFNFRGDFKYLNAFVSSYVRTRTRRIKYLGVYTSHIIIGYKRYAHTAHMKDALRSDCKDSLRAEFRDSLVLITIPLLSFFPSSLLPTTSLSFDTCCIYIYMYQLTGRR